MAQGVTFDISARVTGYEQSLQRLRAALEKLNPGSEIAKSITRALQIAEGKTKELSKNLTPKVTNDSQLDRMTAKVNEAGEAIMRVSHLMQEIGTDDLKLGSFSEDINIMLQDIKKLEQEFSTNLSNGFRDIINNSQELQALFKDFNIDVKDKDAGEIFDILTKKSEEAANRVTTATQKLDKANEDLAKRQSHLAELQSSPFNNKDVVEADIQNIISQYSQMRNKIQEGLKNALGDKGNQEQLLNDFMKDLSPDNFARKVQELKDKIIAELGKDPKEKGISTTIYKALFGDDIGKANNAIAISAVFNKITPIISEVKQQLQQKVTELSSGLTPTQTGNLLTLISEENIEKAVAQTLQYLQKGYNRIQGEIVRENAAIADSQKNVDVAFNEQVDAAVSKELLDLALKDLQNKYDEVKQENQYLKDEINNLKSTIGQRRTEDTNKIKQEGANAGEQAKQWELSTNEVNEYSQALDKAREREQLVGKIEGVVQRWFSIYAAVRMVNNAIKSMISTIKELDKTITNIAIVTDMTQADLWKQMPQYTAMAQEYAVSISGVYEVSQLYYQQGLQTNDVMKLTSETLKMARIAGLDYAEATNYMTNALRSFKLANDEAARVTDVYSSLAASAAISVSELAEAMSKTASSAYAVGSSIEATSAMITVMVEATRESATNIGSAMKSIISRLK